ncbi:NUDIX domain-containing protein [Patescibacteria group bacterium]|nr:MAG: NUDIX domain-containing protein [Patescibacteria group bacterium]
MLERKTTARGIIYRDGKLFLQKLKHSDGVNDFWSTPGGKLDPCESIVNGVSRELIEETGVAPKVGRLLFVQQFLDKDVEFTEFFFHIENPEDYESIDLSATSHGELEIAHFGFVDPKNEHVLPRFLSDIDLDDCIQNIKPVYFYHEAREG